MMIFFVEMQLITKWIRINGEESLKNGFKFIKL